MNILVTGSKGQLGSELQALSSQYAAYTFCFTDKNELNICNIQAVEHFIERNKIQVVINAAAYTNVEEAEVHLTKAKELNFLAVQGLAILAKKHEFKLIHISTDYVFNGKNAIPYLEDDVVSPINNYGISKLLGEEAILKEQSSNSIIIRTSWLYSSFGNNFVKTILKLLNEKDKISVISDQIGSPTYAYDLAKTILDLLPKINNVKPEIFHYANSGDCSWFEFAKEIKNHSNSKCKIVEVTSGAFKTKAERPKHSVLNTEKIKKTFQVEIPNWKNSLKQCLDKINASFRA